MSLTAPHYRSTRARGGEGISFREALLSGLAPDGGLYLPTRIPPLTGLWESADEFPELALRALTPWLADEVPVEVLEPLIKEALAFPVPVVPLADELFILELFHGPTLSFKDFGARVMARLMSYFLLKSGRQLTILVATSGDTGSAVADGFAAQTNIRVVLLYPQGRISDVQQRQLIVSRPGVEAYAVKGTFDDCQRLVKEAFTDPGLSRLALSSANSINIGRLLPQSLYYLWGARQLWRQLGQGEKSLIICVPSGNLGNLTGGVLATRMGLPVRRFLAAHNANDYFPSYLERRVKAYDFRPTIATISNAMDVGAPSNFERLDALLDDDIRELVWSTSVSDEVTRERMRITFEETGYLACPHTAVGLETLARYRAATGEKGPALVLATAHSAKFPQVATEVLGGQPPTHPELEALRSRPTRVHSLEPTLAALREALVR